jgi:SAM-dependent methyltransferase
MAQYLRIDGCDHLLLPGKPADYLDTAVMGAENRALLGERQVMLQILGDETPLPTTQAREGYFDDRHVEYWLSGLRDMRKVVAATGLDRVDAPRILDFGGASGRVVRHFRGWKPDGRLYLSDINPQHVRLVQQMFGRAVTGLHNHGLPTLPFPDDYLDCVIAFSVFTHIDADDIAWLMELRRIVKPGGHLYITIHDQATWKILPQTVLGGPSLSNDDFRAYHSANPDLQGRAVHTYNDATDYNCNVFLGKDYIESVWVPLFTQYSIASLAHDHQAAVTFTV